MEANKKRDLLEGKHGDTSSVLYSPPLSPVKKITPRNFVVERPVQNRLLERGAGEDSNSPPISLVQRVDRVVFESLGSYPHENVISPTNQSEISTHSGNSSNPSPVESESDDSKIFTSSILNIEIVDPTFRGYAKNVRNDEFSNSSFRVRHCTLIPNGDNNQGAKAYSIEELPSNWDED